MSRDISNTDDVIDSRDVIERIAELQDERAPLEEAVEDAQAALDAHDPVEDDLATREPLVESLTDSKTALDVWDDEHGAELKALQDFADEAEGYADDWHHGETLIRDSYFTAYAQELCEDIGVLPKDLPSYIEIDWEATARNIQVDYTSASSSTA